LPSFPDPPEMGRAGAGPPLVRDPIRITKNRRAARTRKAAEIRPAHTIKPLPRCALRVTEHGARGRRRGKGKPWSVAL